MTYKKAIAEVIAFENEDVITSSPGGGCNEYCGWGLHGGGGSSIGGEPTGCPRGWADNHRPGGGQKPKP